MALTWVVETESQITKKSQAASLIWRRSIVEMFSPFLSLIASSMTSISEGSAACLRSGFFFTFNALIVL
jgi:hypothetical protein